MKIKGLDQNGTVFYYTGKAGKNWISNEPKELFGGYSLEGARRKATVLNKMTEIHGIRFVAVVEEEGK